MQYIYEGPHGRLTIARGAILVRGVPTELSGEAARRADAHPAVSKSDSADDAPAYGRTVKEAIAYVGDDLDRAGEVLEAELAADEPRASLVARMQAMLEPVNSSHSGDSGEAEAEAEDADSGAHSAAPDGD